MHKVGIWIVSVAGAMVAAVACSSAAPINGSGTLCETKGHCPAEPAPTQSEISACTADVNGPCGAEWKTLLQCALNREACAANGGVDAAATLGNCPTELAALQACQNPDGGTDGGTDAPAVCSPATCPSGCCNGTKCETGKTATACGTGGSLCSACPGQAPCKSDQTCGVDPESLWKVQPLSATISAKNQGNDWDVGAGAPDPFVQLWCPASAVSVTGTTPTAYDTYSPTWSSGGCVMKAKDLFVFGYGLAVWDEDISVNDVIAPKGTITVTENLLVQGYMTVTNNSTLVTMKVAFQKQ